MTQTEMDQLKADEQAEVLEMIRALEVEINRRKSWGFTSTELAPLESKLDDIRNL